MVSTHPDHNLSGDNPQPTRERASVNATQAAETLGTARVSDVTRWARRGHLRGRKVLGQWRFDPADVEAFKRERQRVSDHRGNTLDVDASSWITTDAAAERLDRSASAMRAAARRGAVRAAKVDDEWRFDPADIERALEGRSG